MNIWVLMFVKDVIKDLVHKGVITVIIIENPVSIIIVKYLVKQIVKLAKKHN